MSDKPSRACNRFVRSSGLAGLNPRTRNSAICSNPVISLENYGTQGGVGAHSTAIQRRLRTGCRSLPPCSGNTPIVNADGKFNCNPATLPAGGAGRMNFLYGT